MRQSKKETESKLASLFTDLRACFACAHLEPARSLPPVAMIAIVSRRTRLVLIVDGLWDRRHVFRQNSAGEGRC
jgi:hypothetical protein